MRTRSDVGVAARWAAGLAVALAVLTSCGGSQTPTLKVSVTAALRGPFSDVAAQYLPAKIVPTYGADADLAAAVRSGHPPDLIVSADLASLKALDSSGLAQPPAVFGSDQIMIAYHTVAGRPRFARLADVVAAGLGLETAAPGSDFATATQAALAALPAAQRTALQAGVTSHAAASGDILGDVISGKAAAGLVFKSDVESMILRPAKQWAGLGGWLAFGPPISYSAAIVNTRHPNAARQRAAAALVFQLLQSDQTPSRILSGNQVGPPPTTHPYAAPTYTPTGNLLPTARPVTSAPPTAVFHFTPPAAPSP